MENQHPQPKNLNPQQTGLANLSTTTTCRFDFGGITVLIQTEKTTFDAAIAQILTNNNAPNFQGFKANFAPKIARQLSFGSGSDLRQQQFSKLYAELERANPLPPECDEVEHSEWLAGEAAKCLLGQMSKCILDAVKNKFTISEKHADENAFYEAATEWHENKMYSPLTSGEINLAFAMAVNFASDKDPDFNNYAGFNLLFFHRVIKNYLTYRNAVRAAISEIEKANEFKLLLKCPSESERIAAANAAAQKDFADSIEKLMVENTTFANADLLMPFYLDHVAIAKILVERGKLPKSTKEELQIFTDANGAHSWDTPKLYKAFAKARIWSIIAPYQCDITKEVKGNLAATLDKYVANISTDNGWTVEQLAAPTLNAFFTLCGFDAATVKKLCSLVCIHAAFYCGVVDSETGEKSLDEDEVEKFNSELLTLIKVKAFSNFSQQLPNLIGKVADARRVKNQAAK